MKTILFLALAATMLVFASCKDSAADMNENSPARTSPDNTKMDGLENDMDNQSGGTDTLTGDMNNMK